MRLSIVNGTRTLFRNLAGTHFNKEVQGIHRKRNKKKKQITSKFIQIIKNPIIIIKINNCGEFQ